jgi:hypothetical protein
MRATLNISDELIMEVQKISGEKSKTKAITTAMKEYIKEKKIQGLIHLRGKMAIDYDWQKEEELELKAQKKRGDFVEKRK